MLRIGLFEIRVENNRKFYKESLTPAIFKMLSFAGGDWVELLLKCDGASFSPPVPNSQ
jgi:hypothetical protein